MADGPDRFQRLETLGSGGMATVYRARDGHSGQIVALKVLHEHIARDEEIVRRFEHEVVMGQRIKSANVVRVFGFGYQGDRPCAVFEFIDGPTLRAVLKQRGPMSWRQAKPILIDVAKGLQAAHNVRVTHRDIKPSNILLAPDGTVKLADFGIAKAEGLTPLTKSNSLMGTIPYMPPELKPDPRGDLYSLGIVLYEMLVGEVPFTGEMLEVQRQHRLDEPNLKRIPEAIPRALATWLLQKDPGRRPHDAGALLAAIQGSTPPPPLTDTGARREAERSRRPALALPAAVGGGALALGLGGAAAIFAFVGGGGGEPPPVDPTPIIRTVVVAPSATPGPKEAYVLIVDSSVSMGARRDQAAQLAAAEAQKFPPRAQTSVWTFGASQSSDAQKCSDVQKLAGPTPAGSLNVAGLLAPLQALGTTPLSLAVTNAVADAVATTQAQRVFITVIGDDRDKCTEPLAAAIERIQEGGIELQLNVIGIGLDRESISQFAAAVSQASIRGTFREVQ